MRSLEIIIVLLNLIALAAMYHPTRASLRWLSFLPGAIIVLILIHLFLEQYRWQMLPSYGMTLALLLCNLPSLMNSANSAPASGILKFVAGGFAFMFWLTTLILPTILPVPRLPNPVGPYAIGSVVYDWTDMTRAEAYSSDTNARREVMVQIWYPAQPSPGNRTMPLLDHMDVALPALANSIKLPSFALDHIRLVQTHTFEDALPINDGAPFPVVISSHGYTGYRNEAVNQMETLASAGFIAIAIDHPYASQITVFANGHVAVNDPRILPPIGRNQPGDQELRERLEGIVSADQQFVLDQLQLLNSGKLNSRLAGILDLQRVGVMGLSLGGGATVWTCQVDERCKVGLAMDGWYEPIPQNVLTVPLRQPFMFMQSETQLWKMDNDARLDQLYANVSAPAYHLRFTDVLHQDFADYPLLTPLSSPWMYERGKLSGERTVQVINAYMLAFFDQYLKNQSSQLLNRPSHDFPEVQIKSRLN